MNKTNLLIRVISDTHNRHGELTIPECDVLIHCGDATNRGYRHEVEDFAEWFNKQPAKHKIWVPGNRELTFSKCLAASNTDPSSRTWFTEHCPDGILLINEEVTIEGFKFYGSPYTPEFYNWAFMYKRGEEAAKVWNNIPLDTDVLITHGPPWGILDKIPIKFQRRFEDPNVGCQDLLDRVMLVKPKLHCFGHIHANYGMHRSKNTTYINGASCNDKYELVNLPIEFTLEKKSIE